MGFESEVVFVIQRVLSFIVQVARISLSCKDIDFSYFDYLKNVVLYISLVSLVSPILPLFIYFKLPVGFFSFSLVSVLSVISVCICAYLLGLNMNERHTINSKLLKIMMKLK